MSTIDGVDEGGLEQMVARFYARVRADRELGPVFESAIDDWPAHIQKLTAFWSSVMLRTGRYKGNPMAVHLRQRARLSRPMFDRWLALWAETAGEVLPPVGAAALRAKAARIAESLQFALSLEPAPAQAPGRLPA